MPKLILASQSPRRKDFLAQLVPEFTVMPADVDESEIKGEKPYNYCKRIALAKAQKIHAENPSAYVIAADTPVIVGRKILQSPNKKEEAEAMMHLQSGRRVYVPTAVVVIEPSGKTHASLVKNWMKYKKLTNKEIAEFLKNESNWKGISGAVKVHGGVGEKFIICTHGSVSGIIGLPLYETRNLLIKAGLNL